MRYLQEWLRGLAAPPAPAHPLRTPAAQGPGSTCARRSACEAGREASAPPRSPLLQVNANPGLARDKNNRRMLRKKVCRRVRRCPLQRIQRPPTGGGNRMTGGGTALQGTDHVPARIDRCLPGGRTALRQAVAGMTQEQALARPVPGRWSTVEVASHLADFEAIGANRMKCASPRSGPRSWTPTKPGSPPRWLTSTEIWKRKSRSSSRRGARFRVSWHVAGQRPGPGRRLPHRYTRREADAARAAGEGDTARPASRAVYP